MLRRYLVRPAAMVRPIFIWMGIRVYGWEWKFMGGSGREKTISSQVLTRLLACRFGQSTWWMPLFSILCIKMFPRLWRMLKLLTLVSPCQETSSSWSVLFAPLYGTSSLVTSFLSWHLFRGFGKSKNQACICENQS
jgi:hypothetical protein